MNIDKISNLEQKKMAFFNRHHTGQQGFGKWLTLELFTQIELTKTKHVLNPAKSDNDLNTQALKYAHEEKLCKISCIIDEFTPEIFNKEVFNHLNSSKSKIYN